MQTLLYFYGIVNEYVLLIGEEDEKSGVTAEEVDSMLSNVYILRI